MIKLNHNLSLDLYYNEEKTIDTKEYDKNSRYITVSLTYKGKEYQISGDTIKARIKWLKPDKKAVFNDCAINSDNTITIDLTEQMLITSGVAKATLSLYDINTDQVLSTTSFNAIVEADAVPDDTILSSDEFKSVQNEFKKLDELNKTVTECENIRQKNEETRNANEDIRNTNENNRISAENTRMDFENTRIENENKRITNENTRQQNETTRETQEDKRQSDTATAISNANNAAKNANDKANDLQTKLDNHHFVLTNELENTISSDSTTTAPTANAVKIVNDKLDSHTNNHDNPHNLTKEQIGLGNNDNTADMDKPVSTAQQKAIDDAYANSNKYTDKKIADLIGGAPETLDTLKEVADAISASKSTEEALNSAIGTKANQAELDTHTGNDTIHITSDERENWNDANDKKHTHSNKSVLDGITSALITAWNNAVEHITDTVKHITSSERTKWNAAYDKANNALPKTGGTLTGALGLANNTWNPVGDDVAIGDHNVAGNLGVKGLNGTPGISLYNQDGSHYADVIHSKNIGNQSVDHATTSDSASNAKIASEANIADLALKLGRSGNRNYPMTFNWAGKTGQPSWLWGGENGEDMYVYNPSNFNVSHAESADSVSWAGVKDTPSTYPPSNHNHGTADSNFTCFLTDNTDAGFAALHDNGTTTGFFLKTIRGQYTAPGWFEGDYASGIAFGGADTHAVISCKYNYPRVTFAGGNGTEPNWWMRIAGTSGHSYKLDDFITTSGTTALSGSIVPNEDVGMELGDETHRFTNIYSSNITTGAIYMEHDSNAIYESGNDAANGNGGGLNNLVVRSWWGVSFTSNCAGGRYGGKDQTAVGIDCREGVVRAYNFEGLLNGHSVNADVPSNAVFTDTKGSVASNNGVSSGYAMLTLASGYKILAFHTAARNYAMTNTYGNMYWASFEIPIPVTGIKYFTSVNVTPFATSGLISVSITNYTVSKIQGFVFSPLAETKSISFHVTLHGTAS